MGAETKILIGATALVWGMTTLFVAKRSPLQTPLKYFDAMIFFPFGAFFLLLTVYFAEILAPELLTALLEFRRRAFTGLDHEMRHALAVALSLASIALLPGGLFMVWRKLLHRWENRIIENRQGHHGR